MCFNELLTSFGFLYALIDTLLGCFDIFASLSCYCNRAILGPRNEVSSLTYPDPCPRVGLNISQDLATFTEYRSNPEPW